MIDLSNVEALLARARWEAAHGRPYLAYKLYWLAWTKIPLGARPAHGPPVLTAALDLCLDYLPRDAVETLEVAEALIALTNGTDARALSVRGVARSLTARDMRARGSTEEARKAADEAVADLLAATKLLPIDADAWGALGGVYRRMSAWAQSDGDPARARELEGLMLEAYKEGKQCGYDAYPVLNYLETRASIEARDALAAPAGSAPPPPILRDGERAELSRALEVRRQQFQRGEDAPWPAFDLARGQHYLEPNVRRFLADLGVAVEDAKRVARSASDVWTVDTARRSLATLYEHRCPIDGLEDALILLGLAVTDGWAAGSWAPLARGEALLVAELAQVRGELLRLAGAQAEHRASFAAFAEKAKERWSLEDEKRFQKELEDEQKAFAREVEAPAKTYLRVVWKLFGEKALGAALAGFPALLGAGPLPELAVMVAELATQFAAKKVTAALDP